MRQEPGPSSDDRELRDSRDVLARCMRVLDAMHDGDTTLAEWIIDDLVDDLWRRIEAIEGQGRPS
jgi:hypothetical protein